MGELVDIHQATGREPLDEAGSFIEAEIWTGEVLLTDGSTVSLVADSLEDLERMTAHALRLDTGNRQAIHGPADAPERVVWIGPDDEAAEELRLRASKVTEHPDGSLTFTNGRKKVGTVAGHLKPDYSLPKCAECGQFFNRPEGARGRPTIYCGDDCLRVAKRRQGREATRRHRERQAGQV